MSEQTNTPRTTALLHAQVDRDDLNHDDWYELVNHANQLERELSAAQKRVQMLEKEFAALFDFAFTEHGMSSKWVAPLDRARDALKEES